jgi:hypothetical protein
MEGLEAIVRVLYLGYRRMLVRTYKSRYDRFPLVANGWGTIDHIPDMAPTLLIEVEGPPT